MAKRKRYWNEFKARVALEAIREELTLAELSKKNGVRLLPAGDCMQSPAGQCLHRGFLYLAAVTDWATRKVLAWRLSNPMEIGFCIEALKEALAKYGTPTIFNTPSRRLQAIACRQWTTA